MWQEGVVPGFLKISVPADWIGLGTRASNMRASEGPISLDTSGEQPCFLGQARRWSWENEQLPFGGQQELYSKKASLRKPDSEVL